MTALKSILLLLSASLLVLATPVNIDPALGYDSNDPYGIGKLSKRAVCNADNVLRALRNPRVSANASVFCSSFIQSTRTANATTTVFNNVTRLTTETTTTTATTTAFVQVANETAPVIRCRRDGIPASATLAFSPAAAGSFVNCKAFCASTPGCNTFAFNDVNCGNFNVNSSQIQQTQGFGIYTYDLRCSSEFPPSPPPPKYKRQSSPRSIPAYLSAASGNVSRISSACSCFVATPAAAATTTATATNISNVIVFQTATETITEATTATTTPAQQTVTVTPAPIYGD